MLLFFTFMWSQMILFCVNELVYTFVFSIALWFWGPSSAALLAYLPVINLTEWRPVSPLTLWYNLVPASVSVSTPKTPIGQAPATPASQTPVRYTDTTAMKQFLNGLVLHNYILLYYHCFPQPILSAVALTGADLERLERVERQLALLWEQFQQRDHKQDERHGNILELYKSLKEHLHTQTDRESLGLWVSSLLDQRVGVLHGELEQEQTRRVQVRREGYTGKRWYALHGSHSL